MGEEVTGTRGDKINSIEVSVASDSDQFLTDSNNQKLKNKASNGNINDDKKILSFIPSSLLFVMCVLGIYTCYFIYGFLQEELIAVEHIDASVPLLAQYLIGLLISLTTTIVIQVRSGQ
jgi:hypothetical protein